VKEDAPTTEVETAVKSRVVNSPKPKDISSEESSSKAPKLTNPPSEHPQEPEREKTSSSEKEKKSESSPAPPSPSPRRRKPRRTTPGLSSLADLEASVESEKSSKALGETKFTPDAVESFFKKMADQTNPGALKLVLSHIKVNIKNEELFLFVESQVAKTTLLQEVDLIQNLRDRFGRGKLKVYIDIDPEREADKRAPERPKTQKEVLDGFAQQNETFKEMMDRWKLTFDK